MYFPNQLMTFALQSLGMNQKHLGNACIEGIIPPFRATHADKDFPGFRNLFGKPRELKTVKNAHQARRKNLQLFDK